MKATSASSLFSSDGTRIAGLWKPERLTERIVGSKQALRRASSQE
jgi:hypothetical protein